MELQREALGGAGVSSMTQRTAREHGQVPPTRFSRGIFLIASATLMAPDATCLSVSA
jgi:hypothetical protein